MPWVYAGILLVGTAWLGLVYANDPPAPSDPLSVNLGWGGLLAMVALLVYSVARRNKILKRWARLSYWLHLHIFLAFAGVIMVSFHSAHLIGREAPIHWLNPGVLNLIAVFVVFFSGIFGRYLYALVPKTLAGEHMAAQAVEEELAKAQDVPESVRALIPEAAPPPGLGRLLKADLEVRRSLRSLASMDLSDDIRDLATRRVLLAHRLLTIRTAEPVFRAWIIAHRPVAACMYVLSIVHVVLSYMWSGGGI